VISTFSCWIFSFWLEEALCDGCLAEFEAAWFWLLPVSGLVD
jgi:hypothetical protein